MEVTFERSTEKRGSGVGRYVWRVMIDGQLRATIDPATSGSGYYLRDKRGVLIRWPNPPGRRGTPPTIYGGSLQAIQRHAMAAALQELIPTDAYLAARARAAERKRIESEQREAAEAARERKERAGPQLFAALESLHLNPNRPPKGWNHSDWRKAVAYAQAALLAASGDDPTS